MRTSRLQSPSVAPKSICVRSWWTTIHTPTDANTTPIIILPQFIYSYTHYWDKYTYDMIDLVSVPQLYHVLSLSKEIRKNKTFGNTLLQAISFFAQWHCLWKKGCQPLLLHCLVRYDWKNRARWIESKVVVQTIPSSYRLSFTSFCRTNWLCGYFCISFVSVIGFTNTSNPKIKRTTPYKPPRNLILQWPSLHFWQISRSSCINNFRQIIQYPPNNRMVDWGSPKPKVAWFSCQHLSLATSEFRL